MTPHDNHAARVAVVAYFIALLAGGINAGGSAFAFAPSSPSRLPSLSMMVPRQTLDVVRNVGVGRSGGCNGKGLGFDDRDRTGSFFEGTRAKTIRCAVGGKTTSTDADIDIDVESKAAFADDDTDEDFSTASLTPLKSIETAPPPLHPTSSSEEMNTVASNLDSVGDSSTSQPPLPSSPPPPSSRKSSVSLTDRLANSAKNSGVASAAVVAAAAVNAAVSMKTLSAPSLGKSYVSLDEGNTETDEDGLPMTYDKNLIEAYWTKERGALTQRWSYFVSKAAPFLTKLVALFITEGEINERHVPELSKQAVNDLQDLGPTFIKLGQMMSVRPDVLPQSTLDELSRLQDAVVPFDTKVAVRQIEQELGGPLGTFFTSISEEPVAAASLAQVYLATLNDGNDTKVAVKVQRPQVLSTVSKDLYVLRRAAEVFQGLVERFAPQQRTDYVALLNEFAIGFYTELDFVNEGRNQRRLRDSLIEAGVQGITVPIVYEHLTTRRLLVSDWIDGVKLSECSTEEIAEITSIAQEAFLVQLFQYGFFHADPHPGNLLKLNEPTEEGYRVALIDCGLMATIDRTDRDHMISAVIHLANKDYASLVDDFINLDILPKSCDRPKIIPLMDKALSPYIQGGGAKKYEEELKKLYGMDESMKSQVGGFQAMTQDALTVLNDVPFSIPPYFAILGRAIVTLEGIALTGNPDYGIIMESYPFIARKLLAEDRPEIQSALQEVLFSASVGGGGLQLTRLLALLNNASGAVGTKDGAAFVDLDAIPEEGLSVAEGFKLILSDNAESLRGLLGDEMENIADIFSRQILRKGMSEAVVALTPPRLPSLPFIGDLGVPKVQLDEIPIPILLPGSGSSPTVSLLTVKEFTDLVAPKLSREEEVYAIGIAEAAEEFLGQDAADFLRGDRLIGPRSARIVLAAATSGFLGRSDVLGSAGVPSVLDGLSSLLRTLDRDSSESGDGRIDEVFLEVVSLLSDDEQSRLNGIIEELTRKGLERLRGRLAERKGGIAR